MRPSGTPTYKMQTQVACTLVWDVNVLSKRKPFEATIWNGSVLKFYLEAYASWLKRQDCKSCTMCFAGSNPAASTKR